MKKVYIYALICPISKEIRYIGKTVQQLKSRLNGHLSPTDKDTTYRANWIRSLKSANLKPEIRLIEECEETNWEEREIYWIDYYSKLSNLTNYTKGGNGGHYVKISTKEKLSIVYKEKWKDEEYRNKMIDVTNQLWQTKEHRERMSEIRKKKWENEDYKKEMSEMSKNMWKDDNYRKTRLTEEGRKKMRMAKLNIPHTDEAKKKISKHAKDMWKNNREKLLKAREGQKKVVIINNIEYTSMHEAGKLLNLDDSTICRRVKSDKYPTYKLKGD